MNKLWKNWSIGILHVDVRRLTHSDLDQNRRNLSGTQRDAMANAEKEPVSGGSIRFAIPTFGYKLLNHLLLGIIIIQICVNLSFSGSSFGTYEVQRPICKVTIDCYCYICPLYVH
jgi:hypothetical protein